MILCSNKAPISVKKLLLELPHIFQEWDSNKLIDVFRLALKHRAEICVDPSYDFKIINCKLTKVHANSVLCALFKLRADRVTNCTGAVDPLINDIFKNKKPNTAALSFTIHVCNQLEPKYRSPVIFEAFYCVFSLVHQDLLEDLKDNIPQNADLLKSICWTFDYRSWRQLGAQYFNLTAIKLFRCDIYQCVNDEKRKAIQNWYLRLINNMPHDDIRNCLSVIENKKSLDELFNRFSLLEIHEIYEVIRLATPLLKDETNSNRAAEILLWIGSTFPVRQERIAVVEMAQVLLNKVNRTDIDVAKVLKSIHGLFPRCRKEIIETLLEFIDRIPPEELHEFIKDLQGVPSSLRKEAISVGLDIQETMQFEPWCCKPDILYVIPNTRKTWAVTKPYLEELNEIDPEVVYGILEIVAKTPENQQKVILDLCRPFFARVENLAAFVKQVYDVPPHLRSHYLEDFQKQEIIDHFRKWFPTTWFPGYCDILRLFSTEVSKSYIEELMYVLYFVSEQERLPFARDVISICQIPDQYPNVAQALRHVENRESFVNSIKPLCAKLPPKTLIAKIIYALASLYENRQMMIDVCLKLLENKEFGRVEETILLLGSLPSEELKDILDHAAPLLEVNIQPYDIISSIKQIPRKERGWVIAKSLGIFEKDHHVPIWDIFKYVAKIPGVEREVIFELLSRTQPSLKYTQKTALLEVLHKIPAKDRERFIDFYRSCDYHNPNHLLCLFPLDEEERKLKVEIGKKLNSQGEFNYLATLSLKKTKLLHHYLLPILLKLEKDHAALFDECKQSLQRLSAVLPKLQLYINVAKPILQNCAIARCLFLFDHKVAIQAIKVIDKFPFYNARSIPDSLSKVKPEFRQGALKNLNLLLNRLQSITTHHQYEIDLVEQILIHPLSQQEVDEFLRISKLIPFYDLLVAAMLYWCGVSATWKREFLEIALTMDSDTDYRTDLGELSSLVGTNRQLVIKKVFELSPNGENLGNLIEILKDIPSHRFQRKLESMHELLAQCTTASEIDTVMKHDAFLDPQDARFLTPLNTMQDKVKVLAELARLSPSAKAKLSDRRLQRLLPLLAKNQSLKLLWSIAYKPESEADDLLKSIEYLKARYPSLDINHLYNRLSVCKPQLIDKVIQILTERLQFLPIETWGIVLSAINYGVELDHLHEIMEMITLVYSECKSIECPGNYDVFQHLLRKPKEERTALINNLSIHFSFCSVFQVRVKILTILSEVSPTKSKEILIAFDLLKQGSRTTWNDIVLVFEELKKQDLPVGFIRQMLPLLEGIEDLGEKYAIIKDIIAKKDKEEMIDGFAHYIQPADAVEQRLRNMEFLRKISPLEIPIVQRKYQLLKDYISIASFCQVDRFKNHSISQLREIIDLIKKFPLITKFKTDPLLAIIETLLAIEQKRREQVLEHISSFGKAYSDVNTVHLAMANLSKLETAEAERGMQIVGLIVNQHITNNIHVLITKISLLLRKGHGNLITTYLEYLNPIICPQTRGYLFQVMLNWHPNLVMRSHKALFHLFEQFDNKVIFLLKGLEKFSLDEFIAIVSQCKDWGVTNSKIFTVILTKLQHVAPRHRSQLLNQAYLLTTDIVDLATALTSLLIIPIEERAELIKTISPYLAYLESNEELYSLVDVINVIDKEKRKVFLAAVFDLMDCADAPGLFVSLCKACSKYSWNHIEGGILFHIDALWRRTDTHLQSLHYLIALSNFSVEARAVILKKLPRVFSHQPTHTQVLTALGVLLVVDPGDLPAVIDSIHGQICSNGDGLAAHVFGDYQDISKHRFHAYIRKIVDEAFLSLDYSWTRELVLYVLNHSHLMGIKADSELDRWLNFVWSSIDNTNTLQTNPFITDRTLKEHMINEDPWNGVVPTFNFNETLFELNLPVMQDKIIDQHYTKEDIPKGVTPDGFEQCFACFEHRIRTLPEEQQKKILKYIADSCLETQAGPATLNSVKKRFLHTDLMAELQHPEKLAKDEISAPMVYLYRIQKALLDHSNVVEPGMIVSPREAYLLSLSASVNECPTGQLDGITFYYLRLPVEYQLSHFVPQKQEARVIRILDGAMQAFLEETFTNMEWWNKLFPDVSCAQQTHFILFAKNRLFRHVGLIHSLRFDPHARVLLRNIVDLHLDEFMTVFLECCKIKRLIHFVKEYVSQGFAMQTVRYMDFIYLLESFLNRKLTGAELQNMLVYDEQTNPIAITEDGAVMILVASQYLVYH